MIRTKDFTTLNKIAHNKSKKPLQRSKSISKFNPKKEYTFDEYVSFLPKDKVRYLESKNIEIREPIYILYKGRYGKYEINATNPFTGNPIKIKPSNGFINKYERKYQSSQCYKIFYIRCHLRVVNKPKVKGNIIVFSADNHTDKKFLYKTIRLKKRYLRNNRKSSNRISSAVLNKFRATAPSCDEDDDCDLSSAAPALTTSQSSNTITRLDRSPYTDKHFGKRDFLISVRLPRCIKNEGHKIEDINGVVTCLKNGGTAKKVRFLGAYCPECHRYYILRSELDKVLREGRPLCHICDGAYWNEFNPFDHYGIGDISEKSILTLAGYSVSKKADLSSEERQTILLNVIKNDVMTANEIIKHLTMLIDMSYNNIKWCDAELKWMEDRAFISNYRFENLRTVEVDKIIRK